MDKWYLDENDRDIYLRDDKGIRWNYYPKELVRILNNLEVKLAESEKELNREKEIAEMWFNWKETYYKELQQVKQQLAEKEADIEELNHKFNVEQPCLLMNYQDMVEKLKARIEQDNQYKISFAVEQIKNLKLLILSKWRENDCNLFLGDVGEIIDNQIEAIKEIK